jgi:hypothetical protein
MHNQIQQVNGAFLGGDLPGLASLGPSYKRCCSGPSDLDVQIRQFWSCTGDSAPSEARNGGLGEDPPGSTMTYQQVLRTCTFSQDSYGA